MNCPLENPEIAQVLLDYCSRKLSPDSKAVLERHMAICPACREFAAKQQAVWSALEEWEVSPVSADFDRRLYQRIQCEESRTWRGRLAGWLRPLTAYHGVPAVAAACLLVMAGLMLVRPDQPAPVPISPDTAAVEVQPEQVEKALDAMEVLSEFNRKARTENPDSKL